MSRLQPRKTAVLVIDMQNDFIEPGAILQISSISPHLKICRSFLDWCRDKHISIIFTRHTFSPKANPIETELFPDMAKTGLRKGTHGHEIHSALAPTKQDTILDKTRYDAFFNTRLEALLRAKHITDVIIMGTMTEVCCESTARSAMFRDFHVWFLSDLNFPSRPDAQAATLKTISHHFGKVISSRGLKKIMKTTTS